MNSNCNVCDVGKECSYRYRPCDCCDYRKFIPKPVAKLEEVEANAPPFGTKRKAAMAIYTPPFKYLHGFIYDSQNYMVSDGNLLGEPNESVKGAVASRVRGWGRIGYMPDAAALQDEVGQMMADALTQYYEREQAK